MQLKAEKRKILGKNTKHIKREGKIPAVIFGKGMESVSLSLGYNEFDKTFKKAGETDLIDIEADNEKFKVLIKDVQNDPVSGKFIHVGFYKPDLTIKTEAQVPVTVIGEENNDLIKNGTGIALQLLQEITVEALPQDIPHEFTIDVSSLSEIGQGVTISQLEYDREKVSIPDIDPEEMVVRMDEIAVEEEPEEAVSEEEAIAGLEATEEKAVDEDEEGKETSSQDKDKK